MGHSYDRPFPTSPKPDRSKDYDEDDDDVAESAVREAIPSVAIAVADTKLRESLAILMQRAGRIAGGSDLVPVAVAIITDAGGAVGETVARLRRAARSDAAIIVISRAAAPASESAAAYQAGALLCLRAPVDEHQLLATIASAVELRSAKGHAEDLRRKLDVQAHLASLGRVTAGFTHEVSSPLSVLVSNFEFLREHIDLQPFVSDDVRDACRDITAALQRIKDIVTLSRNLARAREVSLVNVDLSVAVHEVCATSALELGEIAIEERIDAPVVALADPLLLSQILVNLVANAAHAARLLPSPRVRLHVYETSDGPVVSVRDNGPGIPPEVRDRMFEPFFTTRRDCGGTGLGLALCREYAARMHAQLSVWTAPGRGACFRVHLRRA